MNKKWMAATILILLATTSFAIQINVAIVEGGTFTLEVELTDTIEAVKRYIQAEVGIAPEDQALLFDSQELADDRTLADYGIAEGDPLQLNVAGSVTDPGAGTDPDDSDGDSEPGDSGDGSDPDDGDDTDDGDPEDPGTDGYEDSEGQPVSTTQNDSVDRDEPGSTSSTTAPSISSTAPSSPEYVDRLESGVQAFVREIQAQKQAGE